MEEKPLLKQPFGQISSIFQISTRKPTTLTRQCNRQNQPATGTPHTRPLAVLPYPRLMTAPDQTLLLSDDTTFAIAGCAARILNAVPNRSINRCVPLILRGLADGALAIGLNQRHAAVGQ